MGGLGPKENADAQRDKFRNIGCCVNGGRAVALSVELLQPSRASGAGGGLLAALAAAVYVKASASKGKRHSTQRPRPAAESTARPSRWISMSIMI